MMSSATLVVALIVAWALCTRGETFEGEESPYWAENDHWVHVTVWKNGGNSTPGNEVPLRMRVNPVTSDLEYFKVRVGLKLNYIPVDCTPFTPYRPKLPYSALTRPIQPDLEPDFNCGYTTWTARMRVYAYDGTQLQNLFDVKEDDELFVVPAGDHFVWHPGYIGRRLALPNAIGRNGQPVVLETLSLNPRIFKVHNIIDQEDAASVIETARKGMFLSRGFEDGKSSVTQARTSSQNWLACVQHDAVCRIDKLTAAMTNIPFRHLEIHSDALQVIHYHAQQHYHAHYDWFDPTQHPSTTTFRAGANRLFTLIMYLQAPEEGGETVFPLIGDNPYPVRSVKHEDCTRGLLVKPENLTGVLWYNIKAPGNNHEAYPDELTLHGGCDPIKGEKWACNKWIWTHNDDRKHVNFTYLQPESYIPSEYEQMLYDQALQTVNEGALRAGDAIRDEDASKRSETLSLTMVNKHDHDIEVLWQLPEVDAEPVVMLRMKEGATQAFNTYEGHEFVVVDVSKPEKKEIVQRFIVVPGEETVVLGDGPLKGDVLLKDDEDDKTEL